MSEWRIIDTGVQTAEENMQFDAALLEKVETFSQPILHFYEWQTDSATYGYFIQPAELLNLEKAKSLSLSLARRPTGGGIVFHLWDLAFSVLVPAHCPQFSLNTLENYAFVNHAVLAAVREFLNASCPLNLTPEDYSSWDQNCSHFCMAKPTKYDVVWEGKKIAGAAQRKTKKGFLHQGTIALITPPPNYLEQVLPHPKVREAMFAHTYPLLGESATLKRISEVKHHLRELLATHLSQASVYSEPL